jgi:hypothetical protein
VLNGAARIATSTQATGGDSSRNQAIETGFDDRTSTGIDEIGLGAIRIDPQDVVPVPCKTGS